MKTLVRYSFYFLLLINLKFTEICAATESEEELQTAKEFCQKAHEIADDDFETLLSMKDDNGDDTENIEVETKYKCFSHCMLEQLKLLDNTGKVNVDFIKEKTDISDDSIEMVNECKAEFDLEDDACEYGFNMLLCVIDGFMQRRSGDE